MKCPNCGSTKFTKVNILEGEILATSGSIGQSCESYACDECGRIELYMPNYWIDANAKHKEELAKIQTEQEQREKDKQNKIKYLTDRYNKAKLIAEDENQSVKNVKEATEAIKTLKRELEELGVRINDSDDVHPVGR